MLLMAVFDGEDCNKKYLLNDVLKLTYILNVTIGTVYRHC